MKLCGRVLAVSLVLGEECIDDRLPLYVLEYLATDNFHLLETVESCLEQLRVHFFPPASPRPLSSYLLPPHLIHLPPTSPHPSSSHPPARLTSPLVSSPLLASPLRVWRRRIPASSGG